MKKPFLFWRRCILILFATVIALELVLRFVFGFCDAPLYQVDNDYEYIPQPYQNRYRFLCHYRTNSYGMRSEEPDSTKKIVLGLGDSVIYGGTWMDQDSLATTQFSAVPGIQMLNISAGSWGPDNCSAFLRKHGTFNASAMILVCSSHDAYDVMTFTPVVGKFKEYPSRQYPSALWEIIDRYLIPLINNKFLGWINPTSVNRQYVDPDVLVERKAANRQVVQKGFTFNPGFNALRQIADSCHISFVIYLHAEKGELIDGAYNDMGKDIIHWCDTAGVRLIQGLASEKPDMYHDAIHFNEKGQKHLANILLKSKISR